MADMTRDQRHHITLVDPSFRERLARVDGPYIGDFVSWALDITMVYKAASKAKERLEVLKAKGPGVMDAGSANSATGLSLRLKASTEPITDPKQEFENKIQMATRLIEKVQANAQFLFEAWCRHIDLEISKGGKSRQEVVDAVAHETGRILPAEMAGAREPTTVQIVQANGRPDRPKKERGWYGLSGNR